LRRVALRRGDRLREFCSIALLWACARAGRDFAVETGPEKEAVKEMEGADVTRPGDDDGAS
jgi:hypothetical protein